MLVDYEGSVEVETPNSQCDYTVTREQSSWVVKGADTLKFTCAVDVLNYFDELPYSHAFEASHLMP